MVSAIKQEHGYAETLAAYEAGSLEQTREHVRQFLRRNPTHVPALILSGVVAAQLLELEAALEAFDRVLAIQPDNPRAQFNKAGVLLLRGDWARGLPLYESRWRLAEFGAGQSAASGRIPWRGQEPLTGKRILLRCEQGLGDTLQFCRYAPLLAERGASVVLEVQRPLVSLLADLPGITHIVVQGAALPACDFECPLMSLPLAFGTTLANVPQPIPYLASDPSKVAEWRLRLGATAGLRIGLAWRGTAARVHDRRRSLPLQSLVEQLPREHQYVSLQKEASPDERRLLREHPWVVDHTPELHDFSDTAALCSCIDLVISVDTSVAHVSAGLGRPTWILLGYSPGWRWLLDRDDSPWYGSAVLHRQIKEGDWSGVCAQVAKFVRALRN
jgi:Tetratricopeptide repeat/Glycosyltransferase family 9 (heptosyltransferase)